MRQLIQTTLPSLTLVIALLAEPSWASTPYSSAAQIFRNAAPLGNSFHALKDHSTRATCVVNAYPEEPYPQPISFSNESDPVLGQYVRLFVTREYTLRSDPHSELAGQLNYTSGEIKEMVRLRSSSSRNGLTLILESHYQGNVGPGTFYCWWTETPRNSSLINTD